jgi:hypothetical protein
MLQKGLPLRHKEHEGFQKFINVFFQTSFAAFVPLWLKIISAKFRKFRKEFFSKPHKKISVNQRNQRLKKELTPPQR